MQRTKLLARLPEIDRTLPDIIEKRALRPATRQGLDLAELDADILRLNALRTQTDLEHLFKFMPISMSRDVFPKPRGAVPMRMRGVH